MDARDNERTTNKYRDQHAYISDVVVYRINLFINSVFKIEYCISSYVELKKISCDFSILDLLMCLPLRGYFIRLLYWIFTCEQKSLLLIYAHNNVYQINEVLILYRLNFV